MDLLLPENVVRALGAYLGRCPYAEVEALVAGLRAARPAQDPAPVKPADVPAV